MNEEKKYEKYKEKYKSNSSGITPDWMGFDGIDYNGIKLEKNSYYVGDVAFSKYLPIMTAIFFTGNSKKDKLTKKSVIFCHGKTDNISDAYYIRIGRKVC